MGLKLACVLESPLEHRLLGPAPESVVHREGGGAQEFAFLLRSQVMLVLWSEDLTLRIIEIGSPLTSREITSHLPLPICTCVP